MKVVTYLSLCLEEKCGVKTNCQRLQHPCDTSCNIGTYLRALHGSHRDLLDSYITFMFKLVKADTGNAEHCYVISFKLKFMK